jgi:hypothetical protein
VFVRWSIESSIPIFKAIFLNFRKFLRKFSSFQILLICISKRYGSLLPWNSINEFDILHLYWLNLFFAHCDVHWFHPLKGFGFAFSLFLVRLFYLLKQILVFSLNVEIFGLHDIVLLRVLLKELFVDRIVVAVDVLS